MAIILAASLKKYIYLYISTQPDRINYKFINLKLYLIIDLLFKKIPAKVCHLKIKCS